MERYLFNSHEQATCVALAKAVLASLRSAVPHSESGERTCREIKAARGCAAVPKRQ